MAMVYMMYMTSLVSLVLIEFFWDCDLVGYMFA